MKILKDDEVIKVGDILMFGYSEEEPTRVEQVLSAIGFADYNKGDPFCVGLIFALRMSAMEQVLLRSVLASVAEDAEDA